MPVLSNIGCLASCAAGGGQSEIRPISNAAMVWEEGRILWVGTRSEEPVQYRGIPRLNAGGGLVVPGLVDCHTHLAFGGWRAGEFEQRIRGESYLQIARRGGGILSTVEKTRLSTSRELARRCLGFLAEMAALGTTTAECKSGYGLDLKTEIRLLELYRDLDQRQPIRLVSTFLGAHAIPAEYATNPEEYVRLIVEGMLPEIAGRKLARFCDVFVEESAFSREQGRTILEAGRRLGLAPKLHADQLSDGGGALLAAEVGAMSADHLERISEQGIQALAERDVVAVSLPLATLYLNQSPMPARRLIEAGVRVAVATDFNPGSAPSYHLPLAMMLACNLQRMTPAEALKGATLFAAKALGLDGEIGSLEAGKRADFAIIDAEDVNHWLYHFRPTACRATFIEGRQVAGVGLGPVASD